MTGIHKRMRRDPDVTRALILDATERLMIEEGYAAVSSRRVAQELGLNSATIHYYYPSTEDLFIALHRRMVEQQAEQFSTLFAAPDPMAAFWRIQSGGEKAALGVEFLALCNHRKALRETIAAATDEGRALQARVLLELLGCEQGEREVAGLATALVAIGRLLANEERIGITQGHAAVRRLVEALLQAPPSPAQQ